MNRETLMQMPISRLRGLDIRTTEDELLVQDVLNEKFQNDPAFNVKRSFTMSVDTDGMTPEKEARLQASLDEDVEVSSDEDGVSEVEEVVVPEVDRIPDSEPTPQPQPTEILTPGSETVPESGSDSEVSLKPFCENCDAKGPIKHKNNCTRVILTNHV